MRLTPQRERVLSAVELLGHATPEQITAQVNRGPGPELPASTVYRALDALSELGVLRHTHVDHRSPSYQVAEHGHHIHVLCRGCGALGQAPMEVADGFVRDLTEATGFEPDVSHAAIHGWCRDCAKARQRAESNGAHT